MDKDEEVLQLVLEAAESFNIAGIKRCALLQEPLRQHLLTYATRPQPLSHLCRVHIRSVLTKHSHRSRQILLSKQALANQMFAAGGGRRCLVDGCKTDEQIKSQRQQVNEECEIMQQFNQKSLSEIEDEFITGSNSDPERLKMLTTLLHYTSSMTRKQVCPNSEVIDRIEELPLPSVIKNNLNYEQTFLSRDRLVNRFG